MARPIWKGQISFGLVNIPVTLYSGEKRSELSFRMLDSRNNARVRYERVNEETGEEVPWNEIVRAYEYDGGNYIVLSDEDFKRAAVERTQTVEIEDFVDQKDIDFRYFDRPYVLTPGNKGEKGYVLLREALKRTGKVGIAKVVIHTREYLSALMPQGDALVLALLRFKQELRDPADFELPKGTLKELKIGDRELEMAEQLIDSMTSEWEPEKYHDDYRDALLKWIEEKIAAGGKMPKREAEEEKKAPAGEIIDIMHLLKKSVEERGKSGSKKSAAKPAAKSRAKAKAAKAKKPRAKPAARRKAS